MSPPEQPRYVVVRTPAGRYHRVVEGHRAGDYYVHEGCNLERETIGGELAELDEVPAGTPQAQLCARDFPA